MTHLAETAGADITRPAQLSADAVRRVVSDGLGFDPVTRWWPAPSRPPLDKLE